MTFEWILLLLFEKCNDVKIVVDFKSRQCPLLLWNLNELKQWNKWSKISKQHTQTDSVLFAFGLFAFGKSIVFGTQWKKKSKLETQMKKMRRKNNNKIKDEKTESKKQSQKKAKKIAKGKTTTEKTAIEKKWPQKNQRGTKKKSKSS